MQTRLTISVLQAIFSRASQTLPVSRSILARQLGLTAPLLERHLVALDQGGLIDAERLRLTLAGLAFAVSRRARWPQVTRVAA